MKGPEPPWCLQSDPGPFYCVVLNKGCGGDETGPDVPERDPAAAILKIQRGRRAGR